jgi:hypothetical protein
MAAQVSTPRPGSGEEWLSWKPEERRLFVGAYLDGYQRGKTDACIAAGELFDQHKPVHDLEDLPDRRCFRHAKAYSRKPDDYVAVMTNFYTNHPQYRNIPRIYLIFLLTDDRYKTADEIYQAALKGEIRTDFWQWENQKQN